MVISLNQPVSGLMCILCIPPNEALFFSEPMNQYLESNAVGFFNLPIAYLNSVRFVYSVKYNRKVV